MNKVELLAPAGDFLRLKIAFLYGADAVYVGGKDFSLRANATNFDIEELEKAVNYTHELGKKLYVTVNIVFHNKELDGLLAYLKELARIKVDAIITSDIYVINLVKENKIPLELHLSTQASILNHESAAIMKDLGVKRIVLAREASREDIKKIKAVTGLDLEVFIHGAMCVSFSGRCVLSNICTNRDSNRGGCAQICRWVFDYENKDDNFTITPKDLNMIPYIEDMINIGVNSFKVEGRMRSTYYVGTVIGVYRKMIDLIYENKLTDGLKKYYLDILNRCANRESTPQFYDRVPGENEQYFNAREEISNQDFLGTVIDYDNNENLVLLEERNYFKIGDEVEFLLPNGEVYSYNITSILDEDKKPIEVARHPKMKVYLKTDFKLPKYSMMRLKIFDKKDYL